MERFGADLGEMISASQLSDEQTGQVRAWADEGAQLPDIQKKLQEEFGLSATYMDTRFLILDLGIELRKDEEEAKPAEPDPLLDSEPEAPAAGGSVSVTLDEVTRAGSAVSGRITFSDGEKGLWMIDQMGRPGLDTDTPGYRPSEEDLKAFEEELRRLLQG